jgi:hypothetical protein
LETKVNINYIVLALKMHSQHPKSHPTNHVSNSATLKFEPGYLGTTASTLPTELPCSPNCSLPFTIINIKIAYQRFQTFIVTQFPSPYTHAPFPSKEHFLRIVFSVRKFLKYISFQKI